MTQLDRHMFLWSMQPVWYKENVGADGVHELMNNMYNEIVRLRDIINKAMQQHGVLEMRGCLFESGCINAEGQYESGHWEREGEEE